MTALSTYYNLVLYDSSDTAEFFLDYRLDMCGTTNSNMTKIDTALNNIQSQVDLISGGAVPVSATFSSGSLFEATGVTEITAYNTDMQIILRLDQDSNGTVTLNINGLGVKTIYKIDNDGNVRNIDGNDLGSQKEYYLRYNGTAWIVISAIQNTGVMKKNVESLSTTKMLTDYDSPIQSLDGNGANRDVYLPLEDVYNPIFIINNTSTGGEIIYVKNSTGLSTIGTLAQGEIGYFSSDGISWMYVTENAQLLNGFSDTDFTKNTDTDVSGNSWVLDEDDMVSDDATKVPTQQSTKAYVDTNRSAVEGIITGLSSNLIKNYPSLEKADGTMPLWWESYGDVTITEEDATGETLSASPNERVIKMVVGATTGGIQQTFVPSDERLLNPSNTIVSVGAWVYTDSGVVTFRLRDSGGTTLASVTSSTTNAWEYLSIENTQIDANNLLLQIFNGTASAVFYIANPQLNVGSIVASWKERNVVYRESFGNLVVNVDPGGVGWTDVDSSTYVSNNATKIEGIISYRNQTTAGATISIRRKGSTASGLSVEVVRSIVTTVYTDVLFATLLDDANTFQYSSGAVAGDTENLYIAIKGYWEWE